MDSTGARHLAARIRAGVRVGSTIQLVADDDEAGLKAGDLGVVREITLDGIVVSWDRGFTRDVNPDVTPYRPFAA